MVKKLFFIATLLYIGATASAENYQVKSPDGKIVAELSTDKALSLNFKYNGSILLQESSIGVVLSDGMDLGKNPKVASRKISNHKEIIQAPFYRQPSIETSYQELNLKLKNGFGIILRAYDEGVAYRFYTQRKGKTIILNETAAYQFGKDKKAWLPYTTTPEKPFAMAFQNIYHETRLDTAKQDLVFLPATIDCGKAKVTILESDLQNYPGMWLKANGSKQDQEKGILRAAFAPYPKEMAYYPWRHMSHVKSTCDYIATSTGKRNYPWRIFAITEHDTQMPTNNLVYALAAPNKIGDTSWIKPGKVAWDWWNDWNLYNVDFRAGINNETYKYYIDFASKFGIEYVILDEGWAVPGKADLFEVIPEIDLKELISYAKSKNVDLILWAGYRAFEKDMDRVCKHYAAMGIKGFKIDFMDRDDQQVVEFNRKAAETGAKYKLLIDLHGTFKPTGLQRTYPNTINFEGVHGLEEMKWAEPGTDQVIYDVTAPFIRMVAGPLDYTQGAMNNVIMKNFHAVYTEPMSQGTRCRQLALYTIFNSPINMLCDAPTNYLKEEECTKFIAAIPTVWNQTLPISGKVGEHIVMAREKDGIWYVGGLTDWKERDVEVDLSFLGDGEFNAEIFRDGINADRVGKDYKREVIRVSANKKLNLHMAPGGGFVVRITK